MSWFGQVWHVTAKDMRQSAWVVLLVLIGLTLSTSHALGVAVSPPGLGPGSRSFLTQLLFGGPLFYLAGALLVAVLVQADPPSRSDAFWLTRPLFPGAVLAAKVVVATAVLLVLPVVAQLVALLAYQVEFPEALGLAGESAVLQAALVAVALGMAAITTDLKSFVLGLLVAGTTWGMLQQFAFAALGRPEMGLTGASQPLLRSALWLTVGTATIVTQYRTRSVRRTLTLVLPLLLLGSLGVAALRGGPPDVASAPTVVDDVRAGDLRVRVRNLRPADYMTLDGGWTLEADASVSDARDGYRYTLVPSVSVELPDGSSRRLRVFTPRVVLTTPRASIPGVRVTDVEDPEMAPVVGRLAVSLPADLRKEVERGGARLVVDGRVEVAEPKPVSPIELRPGASARLRGRTFQVVNAEDRNGWPFIEVRVEEVQRATVSWGRYPWDMLDLALMDASGVRAVRLVSRSGGGGQSSFLVLPGAEVRRWVSGFAPAAQPLRDPAKPEEEWRDGRLVITDWQPLGSYRVLPLILAVRLETRGSSGALR